MVSKDPMSRSISPRWGRLNNRRMAEKLTAGECIDLSHCEKTEDGCYIIGTFIDGLDYCNADTEQWIWSIGKHRITGEILAAHDARFYGNNNYECVWLR